MQKNVKIHRAISKANSLIDKLLLDHEKQMQQAREQLKKAVNEAALYSYGLQIGDIVTAEFNGNNKYEILSFGAVPNIYYENSPYPAGHYIFALIRIYNPTLPELAHPNLDYSCHLLSKIGSINEI